MEEIVSHKDFFPSLDLGCQEKHDTQLSSHDSDIFWIGVLLSAFHWN